MAVLNNKLTRKERVTLATRVFGLYMMPLYYADAKTDSELTDIDCAMDNSRVPHYRDQLSEQMKSILLEDEKPGGEKPFSPQYAMRSFHILSDASGGCKPIDAICQFEYKGLMISISTAGVSKGGCQNEIEVFDGVDRNISVTRTRTVEEAIKFIDEIQVN